MTDFIFSSERGFIGPRLAKILRDRGFTVKVVGEEEPSEKSTVFINLSNDHGSPWSNLRLFNQRLAQACNCKKFVQFQSFATLTGPRLGSQRQFNCGYFPLFLDKYAAGKIIVEKAIERIQWVNGKACILLYCSAVVDRGGNWDKILFGAFRNGYYRPCCGASIDFNHTTIAEIADFLTFILRENGDIGITRMICNSALSKGCSFGRLASKLAESHYETEVYPEPTRICLRETARIIKLFSYSIYFRMIQPLALKYIQWSEYNRRVSGIHRAEKLANDVVSPGNNNERIIFRGIARLAILHRYVMPSQTTTITD